MEWLRSQLDRSDHLLEAVMTGLGIGIVFMIVYSAYLSPIAEVAEAEVIEEEVAPVEVMIEVVTTLEGREQRIREVFYEEPNTAVAVAKGESGHLLKVDAYNPEPHRDRNGNVICYGSAGVMQIGCVHNNGDTEELKDFEFNLKLARAIYDDSKARKGNGWIPWGAYTDGGYKRHLK